MKLNNVSIMSNVRVNHNSTHLSDACRRLYLYPTRDCVDIDTESQRRRPGDTSLSEPPVWHRRGCLSTDVTAVA